MEQADQIVGLFRTLVPHWQEELQHA
jgi:hypothetical protein